MNKRGQIFLTAAIIIIGILISMGIVYNSISLPKQDKRIEKIANEIKYEGSQTVAYYVLNIKPFDDIKSGVGALTENFAKTNPDLDIFTWVRRYDDTASFYYKKGNLQNNPEIKTSLTGDNKDQLQIFENNNEIYKGRVFSNGGDFIVLVKKDDTNGRTISIK